MDFIFIKSRTDKNYRSKEDSFYYFIKHSTIEMLSNDSAYGIVLKCRFSKPPKNSPYFSLNMLGETEDVVVLVIKISIIREPRFLDLDIENDPQLFWEYVYADGKKENRVVGKIQDFFNENKILIDVSRRTLLAKNRNCPVLLFCKLYKKQSKFYKSLKYDLLRNADNEGSRSLQILFQEFKTISNKNIKHNFYLGVSFMEYIREPYIMMCDIIKPIILDEIKSIPENKDINKYDSITLSSKNNRLKVCYNIARYEIVRMAIDSGYTERDYHSGNIFINEKDKRAILIDYGLAAKIRSWDKIKSLWTEIKNYEFENLDLNFNNIYAILCEIFYTTHSCDIQAFEFKWLKNIDIIDIAIIIQLHKVREKKEASNKKLEIIRFFLYNDQYNFNEIYSIENSYSFLRKFQSLIFGAK
jgi:hypothetical protein